MTSYTPSQPSASAAAAAAAPPPPPNLPRGDLLEGRREKYIEICIPLFEASVTGNWRAAQKIFDCYPEMVHSSITETYETALHIAASAKNTHFVEDLVKMMTNEDLALQNTYFNTALFLAAAAGTVDIAKVMVERNSALLTIPGTDGMMPLHMASLFGKRDMVKYLYGKSDKLRNDGWTPQNRSLLLLQCVESDLFDVALDILKEYPELGDDGHVLHVLARKPEAFTGTDPNFIWRIINSSISSTPCGLLCASFASSMFSAVLRLKVERGEKKIHAVEIVRIIWHRIVQKSKYEIDKIIKGRRSHKDGKDAYSSQMLFVAAEMGNATFIIELIRYYPDLIWKVNDDKLSIFHIAVVHRHESIYNLLYELGSIKDLITPFTDQNRNNMLHLVGEVAKKKRLQIVSGVALQMQRELLWFKEVEKMIPPSNRVRQNREGLTPYELFTDKHKDLVTQGEKWMKGTAAQCMVVATLIATIVFAAAFTVPGGYNQEYGVPIFLKRGTFIVFAISDAISLFSSSASILMFLSILTSRYAEGDFLESLPKKLILGLATLFLSITTMMITFSVSFFILYHNKLRWVPFLISIFATMLVILFVTLQYPLLADVFRSTYASKYLFKPKKRSLYIQNPRI